MHELSICQTMIKQVSTIANQHGAKAIRSIQLQIGPLSGIDIALLKHSFPLASTGTVAAEAKLIVEELPVEIRCLDCHQQSSVEINQLGCPHCLSSHTQLLSGNELLLHSVKLA